MLTLASGLPACGWAPVLACPGTGDLPSMAKKLAIDVAPCAFNRMHITSNPKVLLEYPRAWLRGRQDIQHHCQDRAISLIHVHHPVSAVYAARAARSLRIPMVMHVHETLPAHPLYTLALHVALRRADAVVCVSAAAQELALSSGAAPERTRIVYNGVDNQFLRAAVPVPEVQRTARGPHIGLFGVLEPRKGSDIFLKAATQLAGRFPDAHFWLIGPAALKDKVAYSESLRQAAEVPPLRGRVSFAGFQPDVSSWIAAMDVVAQPSVALESFGMAAAEALTLGRAVVVTNVGGLSEVVRGGETGLIVPPGDASALAHAIEHFLKNSVERAQFGARGAIDSRRRFSPSIFCAGIAAVYSELVEKF